MRYFKRNFLVKYVTVLGRFIAVKFPALQLEFFPGRLAQYNL